MRAMHHCAYDLANIHTIMRMDAENWHVGFTKKEITGHAAGRLYNQQLPPSFYERSGLVKENITVSYVEDHLKKDLRALGDLEHPADGTQFRDEELINRIALSLLAIFPDLTVNLWTGEAPNAAKKRVNGLLTEYFVTKEQNVANEDVNMAIEAEMPENPVAVADIIDKRAREIERKYEAKLTQMERLLKKSTRLNFSGPGHLG